jgi:hypothetical protein
LSAIHRATQLASRPDSDAPQVPAVRPCRGPEPARSDTDFGPAKADLPYDLYHLAAAYCTGKGDRVKTGSLGAALKIADKLVAADTRGKGLAEFAKSKYGHSESKAMGVAAGELASGRPVVALTALLRAHLVPELVTKGQKAYQVELEIRELANKGIGEAGCLNPNLHGQWLADVQAFDTEERDSAEADYKLQTALAANLRNPPSHGVALSINCEAVSATISPEGELIFVTGEHNFKTGNNTLVVGAGINLGAVSVKDGVYSTFDQKGNPISVGIRADSDIGLGSAGLVKYGVDGPSGEIEIIGAPKVTIPNDPSPE